MILMCFEFNIIISSIRNFDVECRVRLIIFLFNLCSNQFVSQIFFKNVQFFYIFVRVSYFASNVKIFCDWFKWFKFRFRNIIFNDQKKFNVNWIIFHEICFKFNDRQIIYSIVLIIFAINAKINFECDVNVFDLIICFEMKNDWQFKFCFYFVA